jgi:hypothetical protein
MVSKRADPLTRDRGFESGSLQRRVCELSVPLLGIDTSARTRVGRRAFKLSIRLPQLFEPGIGVRLSIPDLFTN